MLTIFLEVNLYRQKKISLGLRKTRQMHLKATHQRKIFVAISFLDDARLRL